MKKRIIRIVRMKIFLVLILASPLLVFNTIYAADVSGAILKSEITVASTSGSDQYDLGMSFPMSTNALTSLGLLNTNFKNQQLCVEGEACPTVDEVRSSPLGFQTELSEDMNVDQSTRQSGYFSHFNRCSMESGGSYTREACGGAAAVNLFYNGGSNVQVGDEFWVVQEKTAFNAFTITIETPWSQGGGGTLNCQWYYLNSGGTSSYQALTNVEDPSECFTVAGTHTITWDMPDEVYGWSYPSWAGCCGQQGFWFGFEITAAGTGASIRPTGKDAKFEKQEWGTYPPDVASAGTNYDLYVGGPDIKDKSEFMTTTDGSYAVNISSFNNYYNNPFFTMWAVYQGGHSVKFEAYFEVTKKGGYAHQVLDAGNVICYSNFAHFGCMDPDGDRSGWGQNYNCPYGAQMGTGFNHYQVPGTMTEGWHTIEFVRAVGTSPPSNNYCELFVDGVSYGGKQPPNYNYPYALGNANNYTHTYGGDENIEGFRSIEYNGCWYDSSTGIPSGNGWCNNQTSYPQYRYTFDFTDGWEGPTFEVDANGNGYSGKTYYGNLYSLQNSRNYYHGNGYSASLASANVGAFAPLAAGAGGASGSTELPPADVITDFNPTGTFAGDTTIGTGLPGGDFLGSIATRDNLPISFVWSLIAAGLVICTIAAGMKYLKSILVASLAGGVVLAAFTVPGVGIFPLWVLFFYAIVATTTVVVTNKTGVF